MVRRALAMLALLNTGMTACPDTPGYTPMPFKTTATGLACAETPDDVLYAWSHVTMHSRVQPQQELRGVFPHAVDTMTPVTDQSGNWCAVKVLMEHGDGDEAQPVNIYFRTNRNHQQPQFCQVEANT